MASTITDFKDKVAVVTGGASGIGKGNLRGAAEGRREGRHRRRREGRASTRRSRSCRPLGEVSGIQTDVSKADSVDALAEAGLRRSTACATCCSTTPRSARPAPTSGTPRPTTGRGRSRVNVFGVAHGIQSFVPRMLAGGEPGYVINTSSGDGAIAPDADGVDLRREQVGGRDHDRVPRRAARGPGHQPAGLAVPARRARACSPPGCGRRSGTGRRSWRARSRARRSRRPSRGLRSRRRPAGREIPLQDLERARPRRARADQDRRLLHPDERQRPERRAPPRARRPLRPRPQPDRPALTPATNRRQQTAYALVADASLLVWLQSASRMRAEPMPPPAHIDTQPKVLPRAAQLVDHRDDHARAGARDRVTEAGAAAVDVHDLLRRCPSLRDGRDRHRAERLVDLPQVDVARSTSRCGRAPSGSRAWARGRCARARGRPMPTTATGPSA